MQTEQSTTTTAGAIGAAESRKLTSYYTKRAWIRRQDVPAGQPATGHYDCECGHKLEAGYYGDGPDLKCECGLIYSNTGWIRNRSKLQPHVTTLD